MMLLASSQADNVIDWFRDGAQRAASGPIPEQLLVTLRHSIEALALALIIAIPLAVLLAHYRRGEVLAPAVINVGRAIPTVAILGILVLVFIAAGQGFSSGPIVLALTLLALPPL
jgi:osmoprotectant transport system permease protein